MNGTRAPATERDGACASRESGAARRLTTVLLLGPGAILGPIILALVIGLAITSLPRAPEHLDADASWCAVLDYAHQHGLQFGTGLVFPYGPLGFLIAPCLSWYSPGQQMATAVGLGVLAALGICLNAWRLRPAWRWILLGGFGFVAANVQPRADLLLDTALFSWALLCWRESGRRLWACALVFAFVAGFLGLAKISVLFFSALSVSALAVDLSLRGCGRVALAMVLAGFTSLLLGWACLGQDLRHLVPFLTRGMALSKAYALTMGLERLPATTAAGMAVMILTAGAAALCALGAFGGERAADRARRWLLLAWLAGILALVWKHGYVRADRYHVVAFLGFAPVLCLMLEAVPTPRATLRRWSRGLGVAGCLAALWTLQATFFASRTESLLQPAVGFGYNLRCLFHASSYLRQMREQIHAEQRQAELPALRAVIGTAPADVFGNAQWPALANRLNYRPRPVFQSYAASTLPLMRLNEGYYRSPAAPEYVLLGLEPIDHRFPPLEDALLLRRLLASYQFVAAEGPWLLLRSNTPATSGLRLLREGALRSGEPLSLEAEAGADLWLELDLEPTWRGHAREALYQPPLVRLAVQREPGRKLLKFRAPAPMLASGFIASPLLLENKDVLQLYQTGSAPRPSAYSIELLPGQEQFWRKAIRYRLYRIQGLLNYHGT